MLAMGARGNPGPAMKCARKVRRVRVAQRFTNSAYGNSESSGICFACIAQHAAASRSDGVAGVIQHCHHALMSTLFIACGETAVACDIGIKNNGQLVLVKLFVHGGSILEKELDPAIYLSPGGGAGWSGRSVKAKLYISNLGSLLGRLV